MASRTPRKHRTSEDTPDSIIAAIAARQHGTIRLAQLMWAGLGHDAITRRVNDGRLHRLYRGVYAVGHPGLSDKGQMLAAAFACGEGAAVSHLHATSLWRVSRFSLPSLIDVVAPVQRRPGSPVRAHESRTLARQDITTIHRIPVTRPARMLVDLTEMLTPHQLAYVIHQCGYRGLFHLALVNDAMVRANGRKLNVLKRAIELHRSGSAGTRSNAEDAFLRLIDGRLPEPLVNTPLLGEEVDFQWPDRRLVVEVDGPAHGRPASVRDDARKDAKLQQAGHKVVRVSDEAVYSGACLSRLLHAW